MSPSRDANSELPSTCDIAVVGAGPIGLMLANLLGAAGVSVVLVERNAGLVGLPRAIAYDAETLRLFAQIGLFDAIADGLIQDPQVVYLNARGVKLMEIAPQRSAYGHSQLGTFYQPHFEHVLLGGLKRFASVRALFRHCVRSISQDRNGVEIQVDTPEGTRSFRAKFIVGCDGGNSSTRDLIGSRLVGSTYAERWLVIDAQIDNHDVDNITFFCDPRRPAVRLPAVGSRVRWEFMQLQGETSDELASDRSIRRLLEPFVDFSAIEIERRVVYTFHARVADKWRKERVLLAGDAAHLMPPFAGQGMNGGMKDVANLAWKLAAVIAGQAGDKILDSYEIERARPRARRGQSLPPPRRSHYADQPRHSCRPQCGICSPESFARFPLIRSPRRLSAAASYRPQRPNGGPKRRCRGQDAAAAGAATRWPWAAAQLLAGLPSMARTWCWRRSARRTVASRPSNSRWA